MYRYTIYITDFDAFRRHELIKTLLSHRRDRGTLWASETFDKIPTEGRQPVYHSNGRNDLWHVYQRLIMTGGKVLAFEHTEDGEIPVNFDA